MAVDAHHLHHPFPPQLLPDRDTRNNNSSIENHQGVFNIQMEFASQLLPPGAMMSNDSLLPLYNSCTANNMSAGVAPLPTVFGTFGHNSHATAATVVTPTTTTTTRKRPLDENLTAHLQHHLIDIDHFLIHHNEKLRLELAERRKRSLKNTLVVLEDRVAKKLKAKQEEVERLTKLNWALVEHIKSLFEENQMWRQVAQNNEATANVLRSNLEKVLAAQVKFKQENDCTLPGFFNSRMVAKDEESCCSGENRDDGVSSSKRMVCRRCKVGEPTVLVMPCRHLCLCTECGQVVNTCPVCDGTKTHILTVNMF